MPRQGRRATLCSAAALVSLLWPIVPLQAEVKPGDVITPDNAQKVAALVSPGVLESIRRGMTLKVIPTGRVDWPPPYKDATEKYSAQVRLSSDHRSLVGYVAGQPFPLLDSNDPEIAEKIVWNNNFRPIATDDFDLRFYDCRSVYQGRDKAVFPIAKFQVGHYSNYALVGRTEVPPLPVDPDFKVTGRYFLTALYPILAPPTLRGFGYLHYRYADPERPDDMWEWLPGARRLRRFNEASLQMSGLASTWDANNGYGFNPKPENYNFKFLGEREMLASVHAVHSPEIDCPTDGGASACPEEWEIRHVYVVEATPRLERLKENMETKLVLYMDSETWFPPYQDSYSPDGQLYRTHIYWLTYRDRPVQDARIAIYPYKREFVVGATSVDNQTLLATMCWFPGRETQERECWYINMGAVDREFFTQQAIAKAAP